MTNNKKSDESILFPEAKIDDLIVKPWSFGILFEISEMLGRVIDKAEKRNIIKEIEEGGGMLSYTTLAKIFSVAGSEVLEIIAITLDISEMEVKEFGMEKGLKVAFTIYSQNKEVILNSLKNVLSPSLQEEKEEGEGQEKEQD